MTIDSLSERQRQLAVMVRCGYTNKEIAQQLGISPLVVRNHLRNVYRTLGITGPKGARRAKLAVMVVQARQRQVL